MTSRPSSSGDAVSRRLPFPAPAVVAHLLAPGHLLTSDRFEFIFCAVALVRLALLQQTVGRLRGAPGLADDVIVICNEEQRFLVAQQLQETGAKATIMLEPAGLVTRLESEILASGPARSDTGGFAPHAGTA